jgi:type III restriction enzyme
MCAFGRRMSNAFFERPILNSPYEYPAHHWELGSDKQPTQRIVDSRRRADFVMLIPAPKKRKGAEKQAALLFEEHSHPRTPVPPPAAVNSVHRRSAHFRTVQHSHR